jgi:integrase
MPLKLIPPTPGRSPFYKVRGTHLGVYLDRSTKTAEQATARRLLAKWKDEIERGCLVRPGEPTFLDAAVHYMAATGQEKYIKPVLEHFGKTPLRQIDQQAIDNAAVQLYPKGTPATRNRQCHTIVSAILKHAGIDGKVRRPKGWQGKVSTRWLTPDEAFRLFNAADRIDAEFGLFLRFLTYTGCRLSEALNLTADRLDLQGAHAYVPTTKTGAPRGVHLPPHIVAALACHLRGPRVFRFRKCGRLYSLLGLVRQKAGVADDVTFHTLRHTYGTWMRRYGGLDTKGLVETGAWADTDSAARYAHSVASEAARRADLLPVEPRRNRA